MEIDNHQRSAKSVALAYDTSDDARGGICSAPSIEEALTIAAIHILPDDSFDDWVVQDDDRCELGHYPTRESAELVAQALAQKLRGQLVVHLPDGRISSKSFA